MIVYIITQICLYMAFLSLDLLDRYGILSNYIKLSVVILCCFYVWSRKISGIYEREDKYYVRFIQLGMVFTLIADINIIVLDENVIGVISFIVVQLIYGTMLLRGKYLWVKLLKGKKKSLVKGVLIRIFIQLALSAIILFTLHALSVQIDVLLITTVYYFISIVFNMFSGIKLAYHSKNKVYGLYAIGMILFVLCDINVGIFNIAGFIHIPKLVYDVFYPVASILMWVFYAPSQVLIGLSTYYIGNNRQKYRIKL